MIYLIQDCYKDSNNNYHDILKIGYSKEDFNSIRKPAYDTHNYGYTLLYQREGGSELERLIHKKFNNLLLPNSTEWFSYSQDIIDYFKSISEDSIDSITREEYTELCRNYILSNLIPTASKQYNKYIDQLLSDLRDTYENSYKDKLPWEEDIYKKVFREGLEHIEESRMSFWKNYDFQEELKDLPQILGRQRLEENPWKNRAELYYKLRGEKESQESFNERLNKKIKATESLLRSFQATPLEDKHVLAEKFQDLAKVFNYKNDYVAVNTHAGKDLVPVFNNLVMVSEMRSFEIQQVDYKDRFNLFSSVVGEGIQTESDKIECLVAELDTIVKFPDKMRFVCEKARELSKEDIDRFLNSIPMIFKNYYKSLGPEKCSAVSYRKYMLDEEYKKQTENQEVCIVPLICGSFQVGEKYLMSDIKERLREIYNSINYKSSPKASDLENYFNIKTVDIKNPETEKRSKGFLIISKK